MTNQLTKTDFYKMALESSLKAARETYAYRLKRIAEQATENLSHAETNPRHMLASHSWIKSYANDLTEIAANIDVIEGKLAMIADLAD